MSFFLGIFPDQKAIDDIQGIVKEMEGVFDGFEIPVRWTKGENYHTTILHIGETLPIHKKFVYQNKLNKFNFKKFKVKLNTVKLGISRKYKELVYIDFSEGGDDMRKLLLELRKTLKIQDDGSFIPHLTLGRVSKELTDQEYANICRDLLLVTKKLNIGKTEFVVNELKLVKSTDNDYEVLMNFNVSSSIKS